MLISSSLCHLSFTLSAIEVVFLLLFIKDKILEEQELRSTVEELDLVSSQLADIYVGQDAGTKQDMATLLQSLPEIIEDNQETFHTIHLWGCH